MLPPAIIRNWASKLIASEVATDAISAQTEGATLRVYERLRRQLSEPVGIDAFQALASRALSLTKSQFPRLGALSLTTDGSLGGLPNVEAPSKTGDDAEAGTVLIAQMLRLFLSLLGETATVRLIEDAPLHSEAIARSNTSAAVLSVTDTEYFEPFESITSEAAQLRHVSERLETLVDAHEDVDELLGVAGNIRNIATALDVFTLIRSKAGASNDSILMPPTNGYLN
jgi:hypothetical protein